MPKHKEMNMFLEKHCPNVETAISEISKYIKENCNDLLLNVILTNKSSSDTSKQFKFLSTDPLMSEHFEANLNELDEIKGVLKFSQNYEKLVWFSFMESLDGKLCHSQISQSDLSGGFVDTENFEYNEEEDNYDYKSDPDYYYNVNDPLCRRPKYFGNSKYVAVSEINPKEGITLLLNKNIKVGKYIIFAFKSKVYDNIKVHINEVLSNLNKKYKRKSKLVTDNPPFFPAMIVKRIKKD